MIATVNSIKSTFWCPAFRKDIDLYLRNCETCDRHMSNRATPLAPMGELPVAGPLAFVFFDLVGRQASLNACDLGTKALGTMIDSLPGWGEDVPVKDQTAQKFAQRFFYVWISICVVPYRVHSNLRTVLISLSSSRSGTVARLPTSPPKRTVKLSGTREPW